MNLGFWGKLKRPFFVLAPMADVTDSVFRRMMCERGKPDVLYTEFVSADGLCSSGREKLLLDLKFSEEERPIVAQIFSSNPEKIKEASSLCASLRFDGIDINMGCPDRSVEKQGAGAMMMQSPAIARRVIRAAHEGAPNIPISVKTRLGYNRDILEEWLPVLLEEDLSAIILHARTRKEMSKVPARWERVARAVEIRNSLRKETLIIGNGDATSFEDGRKKAKETGADGVMVGRGVFSNPWFFCGREASVSKRLCAALEHATRFEKEFAGRKSFAVMKKHFKAYVEGFAGAKELRMKLMETENTRDVEAILKDFLASAKGEMKEEKSLL